MDYVPLQYCTLRKEFKDLDLPDQAAMILGCKYADAENTRRLERKYKDLVEWIRTE